MHIPPEPGWMVWPTLVATWGPGQQTSRHAHHAAHLLVALGGTVRVDGRHAAGLFVPADVPHAIDARGATVLTVFVEPDGATGRSLAARWGPGLRVLADGDVRDLLPPAVRQDPSAEAVQRWLEGLVQAGAPHMHPRIPRLLRALRAGSLRREDTSAAALAAEVGLSESRFLHVFKESTGTPLRRYLLWLRLQRAAGLILAERTLTDAAFAAGFADAAHMTRTFRRLFGIAPSALLENAPHVRGAALRE